MNIAKKMCCLLANDGVTSWMFEFAGVRTLKIFGVTSAKKFSRPGYSKSIEIKDLMGDNNHYAAKITSKIFNGKSKIEQHKLVYKSLKGKMGNELHALSITTEGK